MQHLPRFTNLPKSMLDLCVKRTKFNHRIRLRENKAVHPDELCTSPKKHNIQCMQHLPRYRHVFDLNKRFDNNYTQLCFSQVDRELKLNDYRNITYHYYSLY